MSIYINSKWKNEAAMNKDQIYIDGDKEDPLYIWGENAFQSVDAMLTAEVDADTITFLDAKVSLDTDKLNELKEAGFDFAFTGAGAITEDNLADAFKVKQTVDGEEVIRSDVRSLTVGATTDFELSYYDEEEAAAISLDTAKSVDVEGTIESLEIKNSNASFTAELSYADKSKGDVSDFAVSASATSAAQGDLRLVNGEFVEDKYVVEDAESKTAVTITNENPATVEALLAYEYEDEEDEKKSFGPSPIEEEHAEFVAGSIATNFKNVELANAAVAGSLVGGTDNRTFSFTEKVNEAAETSSYSDIEAETFASTGSAQFYNTTVEGAVAGYSNVTFVAGSAASIAAGNVSYYDEYSENVNKNQTTVVEKETYTFGAAGTANIEDIESEEMNISGYSNVKLMDSKVGVVSALVNGLGTAALGGEEEEEEEEPVGTLEEDALEDFDYFLEYGTKLAKNVTVTTKVVDNGEEEESTQITRTVSMSGSYASVGSLYMETDDIEEGGAAGINGYANVSINSDGSDAVTTVGYIIGGNDGFSYTGTSVVKDDVVTKLEEKYSYTYTATGSVTLADNVEIGGEESGISGYSKVTVTKVAGTIGEIDAEEGSATATNTISGNKETDPSWTVGETESSTRSARGTLQISGKTEGKGEDKEYLLEVGAIYGYSKVNISSAQIDGYISARNTTSNEATNESFSSDKAKVMEKYDGEAETVVKQFAKVSKITESYSFQDKDAETYKSTGTLDLTDVVITGDALNVNGFATININNVGGEDGVALEGNGYDYTESDDVNSTAKLTITKLAQTKEQKEADELSFSYELTESSSTSSIAKYTAGGQINVGKDVAINAGEDALEGYKAVTLARGASIGSISAWNTDETKTTQAEYTYEKKEDADEELAAIAFVPGEEEELGHFEGAEEEDLKKSVLTVDEKSTTKAAGKLTVAAGAAVNGDVLGYSTVMAEKAKIDGNVEAGAEAETYKAKTTSVAAEIIPLGGKKGDEVPYINFSGSASLNGKYGGGGTLKLTNAAITGDIKGYSMVTIEGYYVEEDEAVAIGSVSASNGDGLSSVSRVASYSTSGKKPTEKAPEAYDDVTYTETNKIKGFTEGVFTAKNDVTIDGDINDFQTVKIGAECDVTGNISRNFFASQNTELKAVYASIEDVEFEVDEQTDEETAFAQIEGPDGFLAYNVADKIVTAGAGSVTLDDADVGGNISGYATVTAKGETNVVGSIVNMNQTIATKLAYEEGELVSASGTNTSNVAGKVTFTGDKIWGATIGGNIEGYATVTLTRTVMEEGAIIGGSSEAKLLEDGSDWDAPVVKLAGAVKLSDSYVAAITDVKTASLQDGSFAGAISRSEDVTEIGGGTVDVKDSEAAVITGYGSVTLAGKTAIVDAYTGTEAADNVKVSASFAVLGEAEFGEGKDSLTVNKGASLVLDSIDFTKEDGDKFALNGELILQNADELDFFETLNGKGVISTVEDSVEEVQDALKAAKVKGITVMSLGESAENYMGATLENADNKKNGAQMLFDVLDDGTVNGWLGNVGGAVQDNIDFFKFYSEDFASITIEDESLDLSLYDNSGKKLNLSNLKYKGDLIYSDGTLDVEALNSYKKGNYYISVAFNEKKAGDYEFQAELAG